MTCAQPCSVSELEEKYLQLCNKYQCRIDSGLLITIRNKLITYTPSIKLSDNDLLSICPILNTAINLKILNFTDCNLSCNGVWLIYNLLMENSSIIAIDLSHNSIKDLGAMAIRQILEINDTQLKKLALDYNQITSNGAQHIALGLKNNTKLENLDLSHNQLSSFGARIIRASLMERESKRLRIANKNENVIVQNLEQHEHKMQCSLDSNCIENDSSTDINDNIINEKQQIDRSPSTGYLPLPAMHSITTLNSWSTADQVSAQFLHQFISVAQFTLLQQRLQLFINFDGNFLKEEILNCVTHALGICLSILGCILLFVESYGRSNKCRISCLIYSFSIFLMYFSSTLYHSFYSRPYIRQVLRILDYSSVFLLIAGTYTPILLIVFDHSPFHSNIIFCGVWSVAIVGVCYLSVADSRSESKFTSMVALSLLMPYMSFICAKSFVDITDEMAWKWLVIGGAFFTGGVYFLVNDGTNPMFHTIWHVCVIFGSIAHFMCIYWYIVPLDDVQRPYEPLTFSNIVDNICFGLQVSSYLWNSEAHDSLNTDL